MPERRCACGKPADCHIAEAMCQDCWEKHCDKAWWKEVEAVEVEQRLREIEERVSKATPGRWDWRSKSGSLHQVGPDGKYVKAVLCPYYEYDEGVGIEISEEDAEFIRHAREDVPWLLSLLREREEENQRIRHLLSEIERGTDDIREGLCGCGDHSCMVKKPLGMATNGGCRCVTNNTFEVRVLLGRALRKAARLEEENRRLREALEKIKVHPAGYAGDGHAGEPSYCCECQDMRTIATAALRGEHS